MTYEDVRLPPEGIDIHEFAAVEIGQVLPIGRPGDSARRRTGQGAMAENSLYGKRLFCLLSWKRRRKQCHWRAGQCKATSEALQRESLRCAPSPGPFWADVPGIQCT